MPPSNKHCILKIWNWQSADGGDSVLWKIVFRTGQKVHYKRYDMSSSITWIGHNSNVTNTVVINFPGFLTSS